MGDDTSMDRVSRVDVEGMSIAYRERGEGPSLVLLHGWPLDSREWRRQLADLSDEFRVVAWDAPGAGLSSDPPESSKLSDWGPVTQSEFIDALGLRRPSGATRKPACSSERRSYERATAESSTAVVPFRWRRGTACQTRCHDRSP